MTERFPWRMLMYFGLHQLKLSPRDFWAATLLELSHAAGGGTSAMTRQTLSHLMKNYPDD
jgi:uncharacterized phage protein (TIGR02216 family)